MLQLTRLNEEAHHLLASKEPFPPKWNDRAELEHSTNEWMVQWLERRKRLAREKGGIPRLCDALDRRLRTDEVEYLDDPACPVKTKIRIVKGVHMFNVVNRSYPLFARTLAPLFEEIAKRQGRPAKLLELASGSGEQAMALARHSQKGHLPVAITGSDYVPEYVDDANKRAQTRSLPVTFRVVNAFNMNSIKENEYDIVLICGSTHHFSPGQVAMMIAEARRVATTAFVSIDGRRGIDNILGVLPLPILTFQFALLHDAILSGRKFYSRYELEHIARIAAPGAPIETKTIGPASILGCMTVDFTTASDA